MFTTNPNQYPASAAAALEALKTAVSEPSTATVDPKEAQYRVLHDLWLDQIIAKTMKQDSQPKGLAMNFSPIHPELSQAKHN